MDRDPHGIQRRVTGYHDFRLDGMCDLLMRARGASVLDVGCNRGMVGFEFANNGATLVHGVDKWSGGIDVAREVFADIRNVQSRFEVVDLSAGPKALDVLGGQGYDFVLCLAVFHKLARQMTEEELGALIQHLGTLSRRYLAWRGGEETIPFIDDRLARTGMRMVHESHISELGPGIIWMRK